MKILLITKKKVKSSDALINSNLLRKLISCDYFKINKDKLAHIYLDQTSEISITEGGVIDYSINSIGDKALQIPDLSPIAVREIFNFLNDFNADVVYSYDKGYLGIIAQIWSIQKKKSFVSAGLGEQTTATTKTSKILRFLFKNSGIAEEFIENFYHNCTAIFVSDNMEQEKLIKMKYKGSIVLVDKNTTIKKYLRNIYEELKNVIILQPEYIKSSIFKKIKSYISFGATKDQDKRAGKKSSVNVDTFLYTGGAIAISLITYSIWKTLSKLKSKVKKIN